MPWCPPYTGPRPKITTAQLGSQPPLSPLVGLYVRNYDLISKTIFILTRNMFNFVLRLSKPANMHQQASFSSSLSSVVTYVQHLGPGAESLQVRRGDTYAHLHEQQPGYDSIQNEFTVTT